jgi:hypothetical protein
MTVQKIGIDSTDKQMILPSDKWVMSKLVELGVPQIHFYSFGHIIFPFGFAGQRVLNKDPTVPLDGRTPSTSLIMSFTSP